MRARLDIDDTCQRIRQGHPWIFDNQVLRFGGSRELVGSTTKCRSDVNNLPSGEARWSAVTAIGAAGESTKSDVLLARAA